MLTHQSKDEGWDREGRSGGKERAGKVQEGSVLASSGICRILAPFSEHKGPGGIVVWELGYDMEDPGTSPHSTMKRG